MSRNNVTVFINTKRERFYGSYTQVHLYILISNLVVLDIVQRKRLQKVRTQHLNKYSKFHAHVSWTKHTLVHCSSPGKWCSGNPRVKGTIYDFFLRIGGMFLFGLPNEKSSFS